MNNITLYNAITPIQDGTDKQTLIIQYDNPNDLLYLQSIVMEHRRKNSESIIDSWRRMDIFVNLDGHSLRGNNWVRIIYECTRDNPNVGERFGDAVIMRFHRTHDKPNITLERLIGGQ